MRMRDAAAACCREQSPGRRIQSEVERHKLALAYDVSKHTLHRLSTKYPGAMPLRTMPRMSPELWSFLTRKPTHEGFAMHA